MVAGTMERHSDLVQKDGHGDAFLLSHLHSPHQTQMPTLVLQITEAIPFPKALRCCNPWKKLVYSRR